MTALNGAQPAKQQTDALEEFAYANYQAIAKALRGDEKVITAALNLQRVVAAVTQGGA